MPRRHHSRTRAGRPPRDALALLRLDHERIVQLFESYASRDGRSDGAHLLADACHALEVHAQIEQELFYPAVRQEIAVREWLEESEVEHRTLDFLLQELREGSASDPRARATAAVFGRLLRQHLDNEERGIFAQLRGTTIDLVGLGELLRHRAQDFAAQRRVTVNGFSLPSSASRLKIGNGSHASSGKQNGLTLSAGRRKADGGRRSHDRAGDRDYSGFAPF